MALLDYVSGETAAPGIPSGIINKPHPNPHIGGRAPVNVEDKPRGQTQRYAACIAASKRVRWDADEDVVRGRGFSLDHKFLPDGLSLVGGQTFASLDAGEKRFLSQVQGRTYANVFGLVERFINAQVMELSADYRFGDQTALEALIRFSDEEIKHQALFRRVDALAAEAMPGGYSFTADPDRVAEAVLGAGTWAVLALTLHIELFVQSHYKQSIGPDTALSPLFKDVFHYHWREERQHAVLDELEWRRLDAGISPAERDQGVDAFIALVAAVDGVITAQAEADARYFIAANGRPLPEVEGKAVRDGLKKAYRWQYIISGARHPHFVKVLGELTTPPQRQRIGDALAPLT